MPCLIAWTRRRVEHLTKGGVMSHLNNSTTPTGDYVVQRAAMQPALSNHLFDEVMAAPNLKRAWKQVRKEV